MADIHFALLRSELDFFKTELINLRSNGGLLLPTARLDRFVGAFFEVNKGRQYIGVGATLPSQFQFFYPTYLTQQLSSRHERLGVADYRIVIGSRQAIIDDYLAHPDAARLFFERQQDAPGGITLMQVDQDVAEGAATLQGLHSSQVGIWQFGLTCWFSAPSGSPERHSVAVSETAEMRGPLTEYLVRINVKATRMVLGNSGVEFKERDLDERRQDEINMNLILNGTD